MLPDHGIISTPVMHKNLPRAEGSLKDLAYLKKIAEIT